MPTRISKTTFLAGVTCPTQGWYTSRQEPEPISPGLQWRFFTGQEIDRLAREQLGAGQALPRAPEETAVAATAKAIDDPATRVISECTFIAGDFAARADALRRNGTEWDLIEVKSGMEPKKKVTKKGVKVEKPKPAYLQDLAYTLFVARAARVPVTRCVLMLLSREARHGYSEDILVELDVTPKVLELADEFSQQAIGVAEAILGAERPEPSLKFACRDCAYFKGDCIGKGIPDPLFDLPRLTEKRFEEIKKHVRVSALPNDVELTSAQQRVADVIRAGRPDEIEDGLVILDQLEWPARYLDFESIGPALPWFRETSPYEAIPFQFSLHVRAAEGAPLTHHEFLAPNGGDWRRDLAEELLAHLGGAGSVVMYSPYEKRMLAYLANLFPDLEPQIEAVIPRLFDLESVIQKGYCHPDFHGRTSIKYVLPAMVNDLAYDDMAIQGGEDAAGAFALMYLDQTPADRHDFERAALLAYCKLDTLAMVRVHEQLLQIRARHL